MNEVADEATAHPLDDVTDSGVFQAMLDGYDAVYDALPNSRVFTEIWGTNAYGADFPDDFAPRRIKNDRVRATPRCGEGWPPRRAGVLCCTPGTRGCGRFGQPVSAPAVTARPRMQRL
jgi:hypothetical protein